MNAYAHPVVSWLPRSVPLLGRIETRDRADARRRRALTRGLGVLWLLDAALQYQPYMFTRAFPSEVIAPAGHGSPTWVAAPVSWAAGLLAGHIVVFNALFATVQLIIAIGLFVPATVRLALAGSVLWSLLVWWLGEGLGGVLAGPVSPLMGLPGAVVLYALLAVLLWPPGNGRPRPVPHSTSSVAGRGLLGVRGAATVWLALWAAFAFEAIRPGNRTRTGLRDMIAGMSLGEPRWLATVNTDVASALGEHGAAASILLGALFAAVGISVLIPRLTRAGVVLAIVLALAMWVIAQDFGSIATGTGTDPNSGLPLCLLALCYWTEGRGSSSGVGRRTAAGTARSGPRSRRGSGSSRRGAG